MQEGTKEGTEGIVPTESVEVSKEEQEIANEIETEVEGDSNLQVYNAERFPSTVLPSSNSFIGLHETVHALNDMEQLATMLVRSQLCPLKKVPDVILAIITGNQYKLPFMTSINNIFPINGKPTLSVHLQRALILQNKVIFQKIYDFEPMYDWAKVDDNGAYITKQVKNAQGQVGNIPIILKRATLQDKPLEKCVASNEVDRITKYRFKRVIKMEDGSFEPLEVFSEFKMSDAAKAGLLEKDVWVKYAPRMCDARAFAIGGREIASDITLGISSLSELADAYGIKYEVSENFEESVVQ